MSKFIHTTAHQTGSVSLLIIVLLVIGVVVGIFLVTSGTNFLPSAQELAPVASVGPDYVPAPNTYIDR